MYLILHINSSVMHPVYGYKAGAIACHHAYFASESYYTAPSIAAHRTLTPIGIVVHHTEVVGRVFF